MHLFLDFEMHLFYNDIKHLYIEVVVYCERKGIKNNGSTEESG